MLRLLAFSVARNSLQPESLLFCRFFLFPESVKFRDRRLFFGFEGGEFKNGFFFFREADHAFTSRTRPDLPQGNRAVTEFLGAVRAGKHVVDFRWVRHGQIKQIDNPCEESNSFD